MTEREWRMQRELLGKLYDKIDALRIKEKKYNNDVWARLDEAIGRKDKEGTEELGSLWDISSGYERAYDNVLAIIEETMSNLERVE